MRMHFCQLSFSHLTSFRFVDWDMFVQYLGCGIGHLELQACTVDKILVDGFNPDAPLLSSSELGTSKELALLVQGMIYDEEPIADNLEQELEDHEDFGRSR